MRWFRCCFLWLAFVSFVSASLHSQTAPVSPGTLPTFQSKVHVVLVDVTVTNGKDEPIPGLNKKDFQVLENGQPQTILSFEEHKGAPPTQAKLPPMPSHVFTNYPVIKTSDSVNVLLLDWLNTQPQDQPYVNAQTIKYLKNVPSGTRLAIFTLTSRLHMVQGFTTDSSTLVAALNNEKAGTGTQASPLLPTAEQKAADREVINLMIMNQAAPAAIEAVRQEMADYADTHTDERIKITLHALQQLARYLSSIPGRKNVIWFSSSFPISVSPGAGVPRQYEGDIQQTSDLLTPGQVAIYPVSAEGLRGDATWDAMYSQGPSVREENANRAANQLAMEELAKDTGGLAFYNMNGLGEAVARIVNNGTRYYTMTYTPTDKKMDGTYRGIQVKLLSGKYKLSYRRGYYSENPKTSRSVATAQNPPDDPLLPLMGNGLPDFAQVLYKIRVQPLSPQPPPDAALIGGNTELKKPVTRFGLDFAISVEDLKLDLAPDGTRKGQIEVMAVAYDRDGKPLNSVTRRSQLSLNSKIYAESQRVGLQIHQDIDVPDGDVYLRTGIYDLESSKAGTLGIPLNAGSTPTGK